MPTKDFDVLIYVPLEKQSLSEKENNWINTFEKILKVGISQITKQTINLSKSYYSGDTSFQQKIPESFCGVVQLLVNHDFKDEYLINDNTKSDKIIQVLCKPEINISDQSVMVNLFDETLSKELDLTDNIGNLKNEIWLKFLDIAYIIRDHFIVERKDRNSKGKIFVAQTSSDQNVNRETIIRELEHIGYQVLPEINFPEDMMPFSDLVSSGMKECFLSIHLIGNNYAPLLRNIDISSIELQNDIFHEVAAELKAKNKIIKRLVWIDPHVKPKSEKQRLYIESFKRNIELLENTEIIQTPIEVFKNIIRNKAVEILESSSSIIDKKSDDTKEKSIYIISNNTSGDNYQSIKQHLHQHQYNILETTDKKSKIELIQEHYYNLVNCDAICIDYTMDNNQWLNSKLSDIVKSPGFGRKKNFLAKAVLINTDVSPTINLNISDLDVLADKKANISKKIESFIEKIEQDGNPA